MTSQATSDLVTIGNGNIMYPVVCSALKKANFLFLKKHCPMLVWYDSLQERDYWHNLFYWQVTNRLPAINYICRKVPFIRLISRIRNFFPNLYSFIPRSFIIPYELSKFIEEFNTGNKRYIIKPDNGSLGSGITILNKDSDLMLDDKLAIAQEYIESALIDGIKFDLRIYALIASVRPLRIYVYRDGIARFCSEKAEAHTIYSELTNTAINKKNPNTSLSHIIHTVSEVFSFYKSKDLDIDLLWERIDETIVLTILSVYKIIDEETMKHCPPTSLYSRAFQILGFDIILDKRLKPYVLEVNYRPSLETCTDDERILKEDMLRSAMKIAVPLTKIHPLLLQGGFSQILKKGDPNLKRLIAEERMNNLRESKFHQAFPTRTEKDKIYMKVLDRVGTFPNEILEPHFVPVDIDVDQSQIDKISFRYPRKTG